MFITGFRGLLLMVACFTGLSRAQAEFRVPPLTSPVEDLAGIISTQDEKTLRALIREFQSQNKAQFQVLTVKSLEGMPIEQASIQVTDQWKVGDAKRDDGVLFLIAAVDRKIRIEVGQGLEGVLPDIKTKRIIEDVMVPVFRQSSPSQGILVGVYQAMKTVNEEFHATGTKGGEYQTPRKKESLKTILIFLIFVVIAIFGRFINPRGGGRGGFYGGGFGGGGFGGGSGGGWSGGGGGFSGGGSSGSW